MKRRSVLLLTLVAVFISACGTIATPVPTIDPNAVALAVTDAPVEPTDLPLSPTPEPSPTLTPTPLPPTPTDVPTEVPTVTLLPTEPPTEVATEAPADTSGGSDIAALVDAADATNGEALFNLFQPTAGFACATCHLVISEDRLIGPGLRNIGQNAATRVEGQEALDYIYISIVEPSAYVVDTYPDALMPSMWSEIYSEEEIADLIAYLLTLEG